MKIDAPHVQVRRRKRGGQAYYWIKRGWPVVRLPDHPAHAAHRAHELTRASEAGGPLPGVPKAKQKAAAAPAPAPVDRHIWPGTLAALIRRYQASATFAELKATSRQNYNSAFKTLEVVLGPELVSDITRPVVVAFLEGYDADAERGRAARPGAKRMARTALAALFSYAENVGEIDPRDNPVRHYRAGKGKGARRRFASVKEIRALERAAPSIAPWMPVALRLLLYTGQRPGDLLALTAANLVEGGAKLELTQAKTGTFVRMPLHRAVRAQLAADAGRDRATGAIPLDPPLIHDGAFKPVPYRTFNAAWRKLLEAAGVEGDLQARDFRRTAVVSLAQLGCSVPEIASITGHKIADTQRIIDTYFVATDQLADQAITRWEAAHDG